MISSFDIDPFPGKPRILFVGLSNSTHTHAWMDLLKNAEFNVRLFSVPYTSPPENWDTRVYISTPYSIAGLNPATRKCIVPTPEETQSAANPVLLQPKAASAEEWLAKIVAEWRPDVDPYPGAGAGLLFVCQNAQSVPPRTLWFMDGADSWRPGFGPAPFSSQICRPDKKTS